MEILTIAAIGILGGLVGGLFGVGGGLVFVPLLVLLKQFNIHLAIGTSMAVVVPTALIGSLTHGNSEMIHWKTALGLALFAMAGAWLGATLSLKLDTVLLRKVYALFLLGISARLFFSS